jgi:hypothetical protein
VSEAFDPYHRWLGISPKDQPPHHYRLLGLDLFEPDAEVIVDAAQRQMAHVRTYQLGPQLAFSQALLNELGAAKVCLLDPQRKAAYDEQLRKELDAQAAVEPPPAGPVAPPPPPPLPLAFTARPPWQPAAPPSPPTPPAAKRRRWLSVAVGAAAVGLCLVFGSILLREKRPAIQPQAEQGLPASAQSRPSPALNPALPPVSQPMGPRSPAAEVTGPLRSQAVRAAKPAAQPTAKVTPAAALSLPSPGPSPPLAAEPVRIPRENEGSVRDEAKLPKPELDIVFESGGAIDIAGHARLAVSGKIVPVAGLGGKLAGRFENACITLPAIEIGRSPFTVEVLARPGKSIGTSQMFLAWQQGNDGGAFYFARRGDALRVAYLSETGFVRTDWSVMYSRGRWYHLTAVRDGAGIRVYVDGEKALDARPTIADLPTKAYPLTVGDAHNRNCPYTGELQFVRLYRAALSEQQVRSRATQALGGAR